MWRKSIPEFRWKLISLKESGMFPEIQGVVPEVLVLNRYQELQRPFLATRINLAIQMHQVNQSPVVLKFIWKLSSYPYQSVYSNTGSRLRESDRATTGHSKLSLGGNRSEQVKKMSKRAARNYNFDIKTTTSSASTAYKNMPDLPESQRSATPITRKGYMPLQLPTFVGSPLPDEKVLILINKHSYFHISNKIF